MRQFSFTPQSSFLSICYLLTGLLFFSHDTASAAEISAIQHLESLEKSSVLILEENHEKRYSIRADQAMVPASTIKVLTAFLALKHFGADYRFKTDFSLDNHNNLWVKGYGDPFLISEEIDLIVSALKTKQLTQVNDIILDTSYFSQQITINGQSKTDNPYDASPGALVVNFNTVNAKLQNGRVFSAEKQTPVTPTMRRLLKSFSRGTHRISIKNQSAGAVHFAEVLAAKLSEHGVHTHGEIKTGELLKTQPLLYRHRNSHTLSEIVSAMLQYSNNFIANQLFLLLGVDVNGEPANINQSQTYTKQVIKSRFGWKNYTIEEGAGLSRNNKLSARQLVELLTHFSPYRELLNHQNNSIYAKTGTLNGVSSYAGYLRKSEQWVPFALIINQPVPFNFRKRVADELLQRLNY